MNRLLGRQFTHEASRVFSEKVIKIKISSAPVVTGLVYAEFDWKVSAWGWLAIDKNVSVSNSPVSIKPIRTFMRYTFKYLYTL